MKRPIQQLLPIPNASEATIANTDPVINVSSTFSLGAVAEPPSRTPTPPLSTISSSVLEHTTRKKSLWSRIKALVKSRMAFRPPVTHDPRQFSKSQKRWILACLALGSSLNGFCSTIYFPGIPDITEQLNATTMEVTLTTSLFILFGGLGPIMWASMSDHYHIRRFLYLTSLLIFAAASVGCALVINVYMLIVFRCIQSIGTSVTMSVGAGTVSDCWEITERGAAFSVLFIGQFFGPLIGPILGGGLTTALGWRSTFWFCAGYGIFLFSILFAFLPETYRLEHIWEKRKANDEKQPTDYPSVPPQPDLEHGIDGITDTSSTIATINSTARRASNGSSLPPVETSQTMNPFKSVLLLRHVFVAMIATGIGICFGTMFTIETIVPVLYETTYGFESWQTGLSFLGAGIGNVLGSLVSGHVSDYLIKKARASRGGVAKTEDRLTMNAWPGGYMIVPLGVLLFGWSVYLKWTVWISIVGFGVICFGMSQVYAAGSAYLVDAIPGKGASVTAASNVVRMGMACILSLVAEPVVNNIGSGYLSVILAGLNTIGITLYLLVKIKGQTMRQRAGFGENYE